MEDTLTQNVGSTATPSPSASPAPSPAPSAAPTATPTAPTPQAPVSSQDPAMVPSYRIRETREQAYREAQEHYAAQIQQLQQKFEDHQRRIASALGVGPQEDPEVAEVRGQFAKLYPKLAALEARGEDIMSLLENSGDMTGHRDHYWQSYGRQTMDRLYEKAEGTLGGKLSEGGKATLHQAFLGYVASSPEIANRYMNDPSIVEEFWTNFSSSFIDPVRRTSAVQTIDRGNVPLPRDTGGAPRLTPAPKPQNLDERASGAWAQYLATANKVPGGQ